MLNTTACFCTNLLGPCSLESRLCGYVRQKPALIFTRDCELIFLFWLYSLAFKLKMLHVISHESFNVLSVVSYQMQYGVWFHYCYESFQTIKCILSRRCMRFYQSDIGKILSQGLEYAWIWSVVYYLLWVSNIPWVIKPN